MYEFHCWTVLSYHSHDTDLERQNTCITLCNEYLSCHNSLSSESYKLVTQNGITTLLMSGQHNHQADYVLEIYVWLGQTAPGSYGLLYISDDEDESASGVFTVYVMRRGEVTEQADPFLSPRIPTIEAPYDPTRND
jgi:hypothetical protein